MRAFLIALVFISFTLTQARAQNVATSTGNGEPPLLAVSHSAPPEDIWTLHATRLPASTAVTVVVFALDSSQSVQGAVTDADGNLTMDLHPPHAIWGTGAFRVVVGLPDHSAFSLLFSSGGTQPLVVVQPAITSPSSAFNVVGTGFPIDTDIRLVVHPANLRPARSFVIQTDDAGNFSLYLWPEDLGESFFEVGSYHVDVVGFSLSAPFAVYEKPVGSRIAAIPDALVGGSLALTTSNYNPHRFLWGVYVSDDVKVQGEFLVGPTDTSGVVHAAFPLPATLAPGHYRLATPYDWGAADFVVLVPTPTPTMVPSSTASPTNTATPTATATSTMTATATPKPTTRPTARPATATPRPTARATVKPATTPAAKSKRGTRKTLKKHCRKIHGKVRCTRS